MARAQAPDVSDPTAAQEAARLEVPPEVVAQSLGEYLRAWLLRVRSGDSGVLPVILGLVIISVVFQVSSPGNVFLTPSNVVNLFQQSAVFMVLSMAEIFVLLLGEIDLAVGFMAGVGGAIAVQLVQPTTTNWPWWAAIVAAALVCGLLGAAQGTLITRLRLSSLAVTLAGYLIFNGLMLAILALGPFSGYPSLLGIGGNLHAMYDLMWGSIDPTVSWVGMVAVVAALGLLFWLGDSRRRRSGLTAPPASLTILKIAMIAIVGIVVVAICSVNRAVSPAVNEGVPWVIPIVLVVLVGWTVLLQRTRFGRYVYAIGGNPEAARRAGINLANIRTWCFALSGLTAGIGGVLYASLIGGMSNNFNGGQLVLLAVAAAVIAGTSLFGGRGRTMHGVLGGLVIGAIYNGMYLFGLDAKWQFIVTGFVLIIAVSIDSLSRRGATGAGAARV